MIVGIAFAAGALAVACFGLVPAVAGDALRATLLIWGLGLTLLAAAFAGLRENQKRRRSDRLGSFVDRLLALHRDCVDPSVPLADSMKSIAVIGNEMDAYVKTQFGAGAVAHLNNSFGVSDVGFVIGPLNALPDATDRQNHSAWCRYRAARLSELIGGLHRE